MNLGEDYSPPIEADALFPHLNSTATNFINRWILGRLNQCIGDVNDKITNYNFGDTVQSLYKLWMNEICDVYLEAVKPLMRGNDLELIEETKMVLCLCIDFGLRMLHPLMPFITEELYWRLPTSFKRLSISVANFPEAIDVADQKETHSQLAILQNIVSLGRSLASSLDVASKRPNFFIKAGNPTLDALCQQNVLFISTLLKAGNLTVTNETPPTCVSNATVDYEIFLQISEKMDLQAEIKKLTNKREKLSKSTANLQKKTEDPNYATRVPEDVRAQHQELLTNNQIELEKMNDIIEMLRKL